MKIKNYVLIHTLIPGKCRFIYMDHKDYVADRLFIREQLKVKFKGEYKKDGLDYVIVSICISKKDIEKFKRAMQNLQNTMLLMGHKDYIVAYKSFWVPLIMKLNKGKED